ncbi:MAG: SHOCT domain-containing protein [Clostridium sp.]|nr:SHOCT domain-containing protein [Clostridium sp.]
MSAHLRERKYQVKPPRGDGQNPANLAVLVVFLAIGVFLLLPLFPPFGLIWCAAIGKALFKELKIQGVIKKDVEGKYNVDWNKAKASGQKAAREFKGYSQETAQRFKTRVSESDRMEEKQPYKHVHTPVNYSYDSCAQEHRLKQLKSLKDAGILDEKEYQVRKARILAGR